MTQYALRPQTVEAVRFNNEQIKDLPRWVGAYEDYSPMGGKSPISRTPIGNLLVPARTHSVEVHAGQWLVWDGKRVDVLKDTEFNDRFLPVSDVPVVEAAPVENLEVTEDKGFANAPLPDSHPTITESPETLRTPESSDAGV